MGVWSYACAAVALAGCNFIYGLDETRLGSESPQLVYFDNSASRVPLLDFPVLIALDTTFRYGDVSDPERNLRFYDPDTGRDLPFEVEQWDPAGESLVWVRVPEIDAASKDDSIEMHFGPDVSATRDPAVWAPEHDLVVHAPRDGTAPNAASAAYLGRGMTPVAAAEGIVGAAIAMPNVISFGSSSALMNGWSAYTLEFWIYADYDSVPRLEPNTPSAQLHVLDRGSSMDLGRLLQTQVPNIPRIQIDMHYVDGPTYIGTLLQLRRWHYIVFAFDGQAQWVYRDGSFEDVDGFAAPTRLLSDAPDMPRTFRLGNNTSSIILMGRIDELRVSHVYRDANWVNAQFLSMTRRFARIGP